MLLWEHTVVEQPVNAVPTVQLWGLIHVKAMCCWAVPELTSAGLCSPPKGHPPKPMPRQPEHQRKVGTSLSRSNTRTLCKFGFLYNDTMFR